MELPKSEVPECLSLDQLCTGALHELERFGYSRRMLTRYRTVWQHLSEFASELNLQGQYSTDLALRFEQAYGLSDGESTKRPCSTGCIPCSPLRGSLDSGPVVAVAAIMRLLC